MNKLIRIAIACVLFLTVFSACTSNNAGDISIDEMLKDKRIYFEKHFDSKEYKSFFNDINLLDEAVFKLSNKKSITDSDIDSFYENLEGARGKGTIHIDKLKAVKKNKSLFQNNLKLVQYFLYSYYESAIYRDHFTFDMIQCMVCADNVNIKLGDTFKCRIALVAQNSGSKQLVIIDNDTIDSYDGRDIPYFQQKPTKRGEHKFRGSIQYKDGYGAVDYPFAVTYNVE